MRKPKQKPFLEWITFIKSVEIFSLIKNRKPYMKTEIMRIVNTTWNNGCDRIKEMLEADLIYEEKQGRKVYVYLTEKGLKVQPHFLGLKELVGTIKEVN